jgi:hypothetical protein
MRMRAALYVMSLMLPDIPSKLPVFSLQLKPVPSQVRHSYLKRVLNQKSLRIGVFHLTSNKVFMELPSGIKRLSNKMFHEVQIEQG